MNKANEFYMCDQTQCEPCSNPDCVLTTDPDHARQATETEQQLLDALNYLWRKTQEHGDWIPVSERLPEDDRQVLCCTQRKTLQKGLVIGYYSSGLDRWVCGMNSNVIAWRPLPEVYQEVRSDG